MVFDKPTIEFVSLEMSETIATSDCVNQSGNVEYCSGPEAPMNQQQQPTCSDRPMFAG